MKPQLRAQRHRSRTDDDSHAGRSTLQVEQADELGDERPGCRRPESSGGVDAIQILRRRLLTGAERRSGGIAASASGDDRPSNSLRKPPFLRWNRGPDRWPDLCAVRAALGSRLKGAHRLLDTRCRAGRPTPPGPASQTPPGSAAAGRWTALPAAAGALVKDGCCSGLRYTPSTVGRFAAPRTRSRD